MLIHRPVEFVASARVDFTAIGAGSGLLAIFAVMLLKEIGVPVPVPSDLLMVGVGVQIASGAYSPLALAAAVALAVFVGGSIQLILARSAGRAVVYRVAALVGIGSDRLDRMVARLARGGARAVFVGMNVPGARAAVLPAAGLARLGFVPATVATVAGSLVFYGWHVALGYVAGPAAAALIERYSLGVLLVLGALAVVGLAAWFVIRRRADAARAWTEAACPACLAITIARR
jgi:membrane-associated protein